MEILGGKKKGSRSKNRIAHASGFRDDTIREYILRKMKNINWILFLELYKVDYFIKMKYFPIIIDSPKLNSWNTLAREAASAY